MKKFLCLILIAVLLIPAAAFADDSFIGCYASYSPLTTGSPSMEMIYFAEDGTCYFMIQSFRPDEPGLGRSYVGTWTVEDGELIAKTGNNTSQRFRFSDEFSAAVEMDTLTMFVHISPFIDSFNTELGRK